MESTIADGLSKLTLKLEGWLDAAIGILPNLLIASLVALIFWKLSRVTATWIIRALARTHLNKSLSHLLANILRIATLCLGLVIALGILELDKTVFSLLAGVGVIGLALGFAFRDLAANFISGIMLAAGTPFKIGDRVEIGQTVGTVIDIRIRNTIIQNSDGQHVFIPNKEFTSNSFTNFSGSGGRRIQIDVGVGYECDPATALKIFLETLRSLDGIRNAESANPPEAYIDKLGASSVDMVGYFWFDYPGGNFLQLKSNAYESVKRAFEAAAISIPAPIYQVELKKEHKD